MRPVAYRLKADDQRQMHLGVIAQELQTVVPEVVSTDGRSGLLSVNYSELLPVAIKAVQEQQAVIDRLERRIAKLESATPNATSFLQQGTGLLAVALAVGPIGLFAVARSRRKVAS